MIYFLLLLLAAGLQITSAGSNRVQQVHLSYNGQPEEMVVTWLTKYKLSSSSVPYVVYGQKATSLTSKVHAETKAWQDHGPSNITRYTYRATMVGLTPGTRYYYSVGSSENVSTIFNFKALDPSKEVRAAIFGDFSVQSGYSMDLLINDSLSGLYDIVFHIGDIAYNLHTENGYMGDDYMNAIQPMTAHVPYMVIAGNHEWTNGDFNHLKNRFTMPNNGIYADNQFWSINLGSVHYVGISTEYYGYNMSKRAEAQYSWLIDDLKENSHMPWTVVFMHRPMYCSNSKSSGCNGWENKILRNGASGYPPLEPLFNQAGVDMVFWGHEHSYERDYPVYKSKVYKHSDPQHFHNAETPVYTLTGAAGCHSHATPDQEVRQPFTANWHGKYGFSVITPRSNTRIETYFIDVQTGKTLDNFALTKDVLYKPGQHVNLF